VPVADVEQKFVDAISHWLVTLPHDLKILYEASSDMNLPRPARETATGAIIAILGGGHLPGVVRGDFANFCDSAILLRLALQRIAGTGGEDVAAFKDRFAEEFGPLEEQLALCRSAIGDLFPWLESRAEQVEKLEYKGKKVAQYLDDDDASELLYEDGLEFQTEYEVDDDVVADRLKKCSTVIDALETRRKTDRRS